MYVFDELIYLSISDICIYNINNLGRLQINKDVSTYLFWTSSGLSLSYEYSSTFMSGIGNI